MVLIFVEQSSVKNPVRESWSELLHIGVPIKSSWNLKNFEDHVKDPKYIFLVNRPCLIFLKIS